MTDASTILVELDERALGHFQATLSHYLPGLNPGITALGPRKALLAKSTLTALRRSYGDAGSRAVLSEAGVVKSGVASSDEALTLLRRRDITRLPRRTVSVGLPHLWHLDAINAPKAWGQFGGPESIAWGSVKVGQIDTGYTKHPALGFGRLPWVDVAAGRTFYAPGQDNGDPGPGQGVDPVAALMDGHGTRVASVICGHDPAGPGGLYLGVAPKVPLVPVRIANIVLISHAQRELAKAIRYLVEDAKVGVINLSMGFLPRYQIGELDRAIDMAYEAGVILVCAAGQPLPQVVSPAHGRRTIAVAGSTLGDVPWGQGAHGPAVDWAAPADQITRAETRKSGVTGYAGGGDGTSYATAATTGAAALWLARHGKALDSAYPKPWQRVEAFKAVAKASARTMPNQQPGSFGAGVLDVAALLDEVLPSAQNLSQERPA